MSLGARGTLPPTLDPFFEAISNATAAGILVVALLKVDEAWTHPAIGGEENAGRGVKIAIVDSGIDQTHPMFQDAQLGNLQQGNRAIE